MIHARSTILHSPTSDPDLHTSGNAPFPEPQPHVLVVGSRADRDAVRATARRLPGILREIDWPLDERLTDHIDDGTRAVVVASPAPDVATQTRLRRLHRRLTTEHEPSCPIFVVFPEPVPDHRAWALYDAGAALVLGERASAQPTSDRLLARVFERCLADGPARTPVDKLERHVVTQLALADDDFSTLDVHVGLYELRVEGTVPDQACARRLHDILVRIPGLRSIDASNVEVLATRQRRRLDVAETIDRELRRPEAVVWKYRRGEVVLAGSVTSKTELDTLVHALDDLDGVRAIDNYLVVSPKLRSQDVRSARALGRRLREVPRADVVQ